MLSAAADALSTVYSIMQPTGVNYLAFMCWIGMCVTPPPQIIPQ